MPDRGGFVRGGGEMGEWVWFGVTAAAVACLVFAVTAARGVTNRAWLRETDADDGQDAESLAEMTGALSRGLPGEQRDRDEIQPELLRAGMYGRAALARYRAVRAVLLFAPLFAAAALGLLVPAAQVPSVAVVGVMFAAVGFAFPRVYVSAKARSRTGEVERGLPVVADMLSIALLSGQGLIVALERVMAQLRPTFPQLAEELGIVIRHTELYNLSLAVEHWANRSQSPDVRNLSLLLTQAERLGTDISAGLLEYANALRAGARQRLEARTQRATFWMLFPTIFCLWVPAAVILVAPIVAEFANRRTKSKDQLPQGADIDKIGKILRPPPTSR